MGYQMHKENIPLTTIVITINAQTYSLAKYLANRLNSLARHTNSFNKDSTYFMSKIKNLKIQDHDTILKFDMVSLFTMIPIIEVVVVIERVTS
jgi:hypothetical protein